MDFAVEPFEIFGALKEIVKLDLVPGNFDPFVLVEAPVDGFRSPFAQNLIILIGKTNQVQQINKMDEIK